MAGEGREGGVGEEGGCGVLGDGSGDFAGGFGGRGAHFFILFCCGGRWWWAGAWGVVVVLEIWKCRKMVLMLGFGVCDFDGEVLSKTDGRP